MKYFRYLFICALFIFLLSSCQQDTQTFRFDSFSDGTSVKLDTTDVDGTLIHLIDKGEYSDWGFLIFTSPQEDCAAIRGGDVVDSGAIYLGLSSCANANRLEIEFIEPVRSVNLSFIGTNSTYNMQVIDPEGEIIASPFVRCKGNVGGSLTNIIHESRTANIKKISFGLLVHLPFPVILIEELNFEH